MYIQRNCSLSFILIFVFGLPIHTILSAQPTSEIIGMGNKGQTIITTSNTQSGTSEDNTLSEQGFLPNANAASRFLSQASTGPTFEEIQSLTTVGIEGWIEQQFALPIGFNCTQKVEAITDIKNAGAMDPMNTGPFLHFWDYAFWEYAITSNDVLRQRVALALSEILVISQSSGFGENAYAFSTYYDVLLEHAFGNYYNLLVDVTFEPSMALYLTYMNNPKAHVNNMGQQIFPDENYAREVMQLFTIGLCELEIDGTCKTDGNGVPIPTYDNEDIAEFSKIFTGLTWGDSDQFPGYEMGFQSYRIPLKMFNANHEEGPKTLLNGTVLPQRTTVDGVADIEAALNNLFQHPNIGPFIGKLLIQRLVTSNPSLAYVERVARAFNGEGQYGTTRGDMKAVIKAILLDEEARDCAAMSDDSFGKLREPFNRYLQLCRSFTVSNPNGHNRNAMRTIMNYFGQKPFTSPSVFNFFQADYQPIGPIEEANLVAPEFQITNSQTISGYMSALNRWLFYDQVVDDWGRGFEEEEDPNNYTSLTFTEELLLTDDDKIPALIDRLNLILANGALSQRSKDLIHQAVLDIEIIGGDDLMALRRDNRVKLAVFLIMSNPEYLINK